MELFIICSAFKLIFLVTVCDFHVKAPFFLHLSELAETKLARCQHWDVAYLDDGGCGGYTYMLMLININIIISNILHHLQKYFNKMALKRFSSISSWIGQNDLSSSSF